MDTRSGGQRASAPGAESSGQQHPAHPSAQPTRQKAKAGSQPAEAKQTHGKPSPKAEKRKEAYVVQISEETSSEEITAVPNNPFSEEAIRRAFIVKVFLILSAQLVITATIMCVFIFWTGLKDWVIRTPWFTYVLFAAFFTVLIVLIFCENLRRQVPANYILLILFTVLEGLMLGAVSVFFDHEEVLWAIGATALVTLSLTLFALQTKLDFTLLHGVLFVALVVLFIFGILFIFIRSYWLHLLYAGLGTVLFSFYLVMDVQLMVGGKHHMSLDPEEYVFAALNIYLDIINIFLFVLQLIGR
ncbi:protein lifeguard 1-like [Pipistrellus kuhlii]|uniref:protein lifeguard 1-like n=1 Tax=Pipistrellus kuhlii TaxID=59472 RepID=UPI00174F1B2D|nr:protein lifeguard 1-like [Pipistrellus kuhlii]